VVEPLTVAQVTPYAWEDAHGVNLVVRGLSGELARRGHRVLVLAPTRSPQHARDGRGTVRAAAGDTDRLLDGESLRVLPIGELLEVPGRRGGARSLPLDVARSVEEVLTAGRFDVVHVHEPWAPSAASAALRHSRALNVGSFHTPTERLLSAQLGRRVVELVFGRLDARTASFAATRDMLKRLFPADYRVITPAVGPPGLLEPPQPGGVPHIAFAVEEERPALRLFLRALRTLPLQPEWTASIHARDGRAPLGALRRELRERVRIITEPAVPAPAADVVVAASLGAAPAPGMLLGALARGAVPVAARLPVYEEVLADGAAGLLFEPGDVDTLAAQLARLIADPGLRDRLRSGGDRLRDQVTVAHMADAFEEVYAAVCGRRHDPAPRPDVRRRLSGRRLIDVDLHMHTNHSHDCATPVDALLTAAGAQGLGAIAITDHNEVSGALEAAERARGAAVKVIVGEEVKTADQGEVIGLFIRERIPRGLSLQQTISEIRAQDGLVYVPHPFDRLHAVPDYEHLLGVVEEVDVIEVFNPRVALQTFNDEAARFAAKYRIVPGAGSDAHVVQGLGSVRIRMRDFDGPEEFLESLREADIVRHPTSLLYVQALKFLQARAPAGTARRDSRERRSHRSARKP